MTEERMQWESERKKDLAEHTFQTLVHNNLRKELELCVHQLAAKAVQEVRDTNFHGNGNSSGSSRSSNKPLHTHNNNNHSPTNSKSSTREEGKSRISTGKVFTPRHSLMTEILQISHIRTIYHIFIVILILLFLNTVIYDLVDQGSINVGFNLIRLGFGKIGTVAIIWSSMQLAALLPHPLLRLWANGRQILVWHAKVLRVWDIGWLLFFISFQITFFTLALTALVKCQLPIVSSLIISLETMRFVMKMHAFVRSVSPRALQRPPAPSSPHIPLPPFSCYTYFLFAPTLIYRDSYPRTGHIRWGVVAVRLLEIAAIIFYISFLCERFLLGNFSNFGKPNEVLEAKQLVLALFGSMLPALLMYLCGFYLLLHSWLNATSEMLTFADRQFYADWWNKSNYAAFYRTWNMVVHDWLHTYIYKDALILSGSRLVGTLLVFVISAIFHEVILSFAFGFFYPVMLVMFGFFGVLLVFLTKHATPAVGNIFMWWTLAVGNGVMWSLYSMEYFARKNCPTPEHPDIWDLFVPRSWSCHQITLDPDWKFQNPLDQ